MEETGLYAKIIIITITNNNNNNSNNNENNNNNTIMATIQPSVGRERKRRGDAPTDIGRGETVNITLYLIIFF